MPTSKPGAHHANRGADDSGGGRSRKSDGKHPREDNRKVGRSTSSPNSTPGAHEMKDAPSRSRKTEGKGREGKERSKSGASSSSSDREPRNPKLGTKQNKQKAEHTSSSSIIMPGAHASSGRAQERIGRKARNSGGGGKSSKKSSWSTGAAAAPPRSSEHQSSRVEAKLREVGLGANDNIMPMEHENPQQQQQQEEHNVPNAYVVDGGNEEDNQGQRQQEVVVVSTPVADGNTPQGIDDNGNQNGNHRRRPSWGTVVVVLLLVIVGGALAAVFLIRGTTSESDPPGAAPISTDDSIIISNTPTAPPTNKKVLLDPPSPEHCEAIANNQTLPGLVLGSLPLQRNFNIDIQINIRDGDNGIKDEVVLDVVKGIQAILLPSIAGCFNSDGDQRRKLVDDDVNSGLTGGRIRHGTRSRRSLEEVVESRTRFAIVFASAKGRVQENAVCVNITSTPESSCYVILVELSIYLNSDVISSSSSAEELLSVIYEELESGNDIISKLDLPDLFLSANATRITDVTPLSGLVYQPPTKANCEAIATNQTIAGREQMEDINILLSIDVVLSGDKNTTTMTEPLVQELLGAIQERFLPSLAGCNVVVGEFDVEDWRFVIFDAFVTDGKVEPDQRCQAHNEADVPTQNCHPMSVNLNLFLKGSVRDFNIVGLIVEEWGWGSALSNLGLSDPFLIVQLIGGTSATLTSSPSAMPSSSSPSQTPSSSSSSRSLTPSSSSSSSPSGLLVLP